MLCCERFFANALSTEYKDSYRETYDSLEYLTDSRATGLGLPINHFPKKNTNNLRCADGDCQTFGTTSKIVTALMRHALAGVLLLGLMLH